MMNQAAKSRRSWAVYALLFAVTGLVTTVAAVEKPVEGLAGKSVISENESEVSKLPVAEIEKKSRYVVQKGDSLYWAITPKMSFNELTKLKQTIEKLTQYTVGFTQIKFDPFQLYIDIIDVSVYAKSGGSGSTSDGDENDGPIKSIGGYLTHKGDLSIGELDDQDNMPAVLKQLVENDEKAVAKLIAEKRIDYFIEKNKKNGAGGNATLKGQWLRDNPGRKNENFGVFINTENRLQFYDPEKVTVMIDGKEVKAEQVTSLNPKQLHTVIVMDSYPDRKRYVQLFLNQ
ncbi:hypothetical protein [Larkinella terrae]|uniref:Uncharacterized protein n=1 Tax=Larkinella terrae TaxID=2025311 RepID=A0A7K0EHZ0_9BACT|nr:hypothetical protein [Larkinella terrae]MRS61460.1 hypothetical protein [Larkinella terrae]